jgi:DHA2 family multidrug resistance protein
LLQTLFGYDATTSGLVLSPSGIFAIIMLVIVGRLLGRGVDARYLIAGGLFILGVGAYWMSLLNLDISPWQIVWPRVLFIMGLSSIFAPLNVAAFINIPPQLRGAAVGLLALLRNEGGSVGTSVAQTIVQRREQFHALRLGENLDPLNPAVNSYLDQTQPIFLQQTGDPVAAKQMALQNLADLREQQSLALAYFDTFFVIAVGAVALIVLIFFMKRSVAAKDAHVAAE